MYCNFSDIEGKQLTVEKVFAMVGQEQLWSHFLNGPITLNKTISAPYRKDLKPSFMLWFDPKSTKIKFSDFGKGTGGDLFDYLWLTEGLGLTDALLKINSTFSLGLSNKFDPGNRKNTKEIVKVAEYIKQSTEPKLIQVVPRSYTTEDYKYWNSYGILSETLRLYSVYCVGQLYIDKRLVYSHRQENPGYAYYFERSKHVKVYFPYGELRFIGNTNNYHDVQGYYQCRVKEDYEGKMLVLTKSLKDCMLLHQCGIDAMATHGETHKFTEDFMRHITKYYKHIVSLYDRDRSGVKGAYYLWKKYRIPALFLPLKYRNSGAKDITDLCKIYGKETLEEFIMSKVTKKI